MKQPMAYLGIYKSNWAGYTFKAPLGYTSGVHTGVDYNHGTNDEGYRIYAIASGVVAGTKANGQVRGFGNALIIKTKGSCIGGANMYHRYLHAKSFIVKTGDIIKAGQIIGYVGTTGGVPAHLHLDLWHDGNGLGAHWDYHKNTALSSYADPYRTIINNPNWDEKGNEVANRTQVNNIYKAILHRNGDAGGLTNYTGRDANAIVSDFMSSQEFKNHNAFVASAKKQIQALQTALANEKNKPPTVVTKEVEKIVTKIERIEVPTEVIVEKNPSWLQKAIDFINNVLRSK